MPLEEQKFLNLRPLLLKSKKGRDLLEGKRAIAVFPRYRKERRPDKNWSQAKYEELINQLLNNFTNHKVVVCGAPGGAYFSDSCPEHVIDLINLIPAERANIQAAILQRSDFAVGGLSGAMFFAHYWCEFVLGIRT